MNYSEPLGARRLLAAAIVALLACFAFSAFAAHADAAKRKAKPVKVTIANIVTKNQQQLLKQKKLVVKVRSTGKATPKISVVSNGKKNFFKTKKVKFKKKGTKKVVLALTAQGKTQLGKCGKKTVKVVANYKRGKKKATASRKKPLAKWNGNPNCDQPPKPPAPERPVCDPLDPTVCMQPFPSNLYTKADSSTETGLRLDIPAEAMPKNREGKPIDPTDINRADGFSVGNLISVKVPEVETPAAFNNSGIVPADNIAAYQDANAPVMVIDVETGQRHPIYAELDANPTTKATVELTPGQPPVVIEGGHPNDNPTNTKDVNLLIRPAKNFTPGHRYVVVLRNLKNEANAAVSAPEPFAKCRDNEQIMDAELIYRCDQLKDKVFPVLDSSGIAKDSSLYLAWDFTVASDKSIAGRALKIRDAAFAKLGDTNLANRTIEGDAPEWEITAVCDAVEGGDCGPNNYPGLPSYNKNDPITVSAPGSNEQRVVAGTIKNVPCFLNQNGCPTGAQFEFDSNNELVWNENYTVDVDFICTIPKSVVAGGELHPGPTGVYGHGLLGALNQVRSGGSTREIGNVQDSTWCGTNWDGFSENDFLTVAASLSDLSNFNKLVDRMQQGFVNFMMIQRAMVHPDGFATDPAFQVDPDGPGGEPAGSVIDTSAGVNTRAMYHGISQGGIMGGAYTALAPDVDYGVLGVPGINYSTLLQRSVDFDEYAHGIIGNMYLPNVGLYDNYTNQAEYPLVFAMMQLLWDRGEGNGYVHTMNPANDPLPNTNEHRVLLGVAIGDHQVANIAAEVEARTLGASRYAPTLLPSRHWDNEFFGIPAKTAPYANENTLVYYDGGPETYNCEGPNDPPGCRGKGSKVPPIENVPPRPEWGYGGDPHSYPRHSPNGINQAAAFLSGDGVIECVGLDKLCLTNGWNGTAGLP